jgi:hypothetical protein
VKLPSRDLAGYHGHQVYIRDAQHVPPPREAVREMMPVLFELLRDELSASVRAVLGHEFHILGLVRGGLLQPHYSTSGAYLRAVGPQIERRDELSPAGRRPVDLTRPMVFGRMPPRRCWRPHAAAPPHSSRCRQQSPPGPAPHRALVVLYPPSWHVTTRSVVGTGSMPPIRRAAMATQPVSLR